MSAHPSTVTCNTCGSRYANDGRPCPKCNPRTVTFEEWSVQQEEAARQARRPKYWDNKA